MHVLVTRPVPFFVRVITLILSFGTVLGCGYFNVEVKDSPVSSFAAASVSIQKETLPASIVIQEGNTFIFNITLNKSLDYECQLEMRFHGTQNELDSQYFNLSMTKITIPAGQTSAIVSITPLDDTIFHFPSQWSLNLQSKTSQIESLDNLEFNLNDNDSSSIPSFGKTRTNFATIPLSSETATALQVQSDGKILAAGYSNASGSNDFTLIRYNGGASTLDNTFGSSGKILTDIGSGSNDQALAMKIQSDGKIVVAGISNTNGNNDFTMVRYTSTGLIDTTFGTNGKVITDIGSGSIDFAQSMQIQPDGKIFLAGYSNVSGENDYVLVRYDANGKIDLSFGNNGKIITNVSANDFVYSMKIQSDGKIILAGASFSNNYDFSMVRYTPEGILDTTFGNNGKVITDIGTNSTDYGKAIEIQNNGKILFVGTSNGGSNSDVALLRYNANGTIDTSFATNGKVITDVGTNTSDQATSIQVKSDGKILVAGFVNSFNNDFMLMQYTLLGVLDSSFGLNGKVTTDLGSSSKDTVYDFKLLGSGKILIAGSSMITSTSDFALARYLSTGVLDDTFGTTAGKVMTDIGTGSSDVVTSSQIQTGGKIILAGYSNSNINGNYDFALARYYAGGYIDLTFGSQGKIITDINSNSDDYITGIDIQSNGKIVVAGYTNHIGAYDFALARYNNTGTLDTTFGSNGKVITDINSQSMDKSSALKLQSDGKILVAGTTRTGTNHDFVVVRYTSTGVLDTTFGNNGKVITDIGSATWDEAYSLQIQSDGKILVAGISNLSGNQDFTLLRYTTEGVLDTTFGANGKVITNIGANDYAYAMQIQSDGKILVAGTSYVMGSNDYILARYTTDGSVDTSFGDNGIVAVDIGVNSNDSADSLTIDDDGTILLSGSTSINGKYNTTIVQLTPTGALDLTFGANGKVVTDISSSFAMDHNPIHVQEDGNIVLGSTSKEFDISTFDFLLGILNFQGSPIN